MVNENAYFSFSFIKVFNEYYNMVMLFWYHVKKFLILFTLSNIKKFT